MPSKRRKWGCFPKRQRDGHRPCRRGSQLSASALWEPAAEQESRPCAPSPPAQPPGVTQWSADQLSPCQRNTGTTSEVRSSSVWRKESGSSLVLTSNPTGYRLVRPYPDPNYTLLPDLLQSEGLTHFRPWVKILFKSKVSLRSRLERLNKKGHASQCNWADGMHQHFHTLQWQKKWNEAPLKDHRVQRIMGNPIWANISSP